MKGAGARGPGRVKLIVVIGIAGAAAFGLFLSYLAYTVDSFPSHQKAFGDYATVLASEFNGTEFYFKLQWTSSGNYTPLFTQLTSPASDTANTPVCEIGLGPISKGRTLDLPFGLAAPRAALRNVDLSIAVRANSNMTEFTIVYHIDSVSAQPGTITPSNFVCSQRHYSM